MASLRQFLVRAETGTKVVPLFVPKAPETSEMSETFKRISGDIAPNGYKGFGANPRQD